MKLPGKVLLHELDLNRPQGSKGDAFEFFVYSRKNRGAHLLQTHHCDEARKIGENIASPLLDLRKSTFWYDRTKQCQTHPSYGMRQIIQELGTYKRGNVQLMWKLARQYGTRGSQTPIAQKTLGSQCVIFCQYVTAWQSILIGSGVCMEYLVRHFVNDLLQTAQTDPVHRVLCFCRFDVLRHPGGHH